MKGKKLLSVIIALCMIMQIIPVLAQEAVTPSAPAGGGGGYDINYIINDDFGDSAEAPETDDWTLENAFDTTTMDAVYDETLGGYFLKYEATTTDGGKLGNGSTVLDDETHVLRTLPNGGITYEEGKNVVIETRYMQTGASARSFLRANINTKVPNVLGWNFAVLFGINSGKVYYSNGVASNTQGNIKGFAAPFNDGSYTDKFVNAKIVILGDTNTANITLSDDDGNTQTVTANLAQPENAQVVTDALKTLAFNFRNAPNTIYVDYVRVYEEYDAKLYVNDTYKYDEPVSISFSEANYAFLDATDIYDADGNVVTVTKEISEDYKTVTFNANLTEGNVYTVKVDTSILGPQMGMTESEKTFKAMDKTYAIYDDFGDGDAEGWAQIIDESKANHCTMTTEEVDGGYALTYQSFQTATNADTSDWQFEFIKRDLKDIVFTDDKDVVIETKIKQSGSGRSFLKMNLNSVTSDRSDASEWNYNWGTLFQNSKGIGSIPNGWKTDGYMNAKSLTNITDTKDKWLNVKVTIHNTSKTASYVITTDDEIKDEIVATSIDFPDAANWEESILDSLAFRLRDIDKLYVDYVKVYEEFYPTEIEMSTFDAYAFDGAVKVAFNEIEEDFVNAVAIYDAEGNLVEGSNTIDIENKTVIVTPDEDLTLNGVYTVKFDTDALSDGYTMAVSEKTFKAKDTDYVIYDDFGDDTQNASMEEWELKEAFATTSADGIYDETLGGYFLKYEATTTDGGKLGNGSTTLDDETHVLRTLPNGGITYEEGKNVVIETRYMQTGASARSFLRANINTKVPNVLGWNLAVLFGINSGKVYYSNGVASNTQGNIKGFAAPFNDGSYTNKFVNAKIVILGNTNTANITLSDDDGNTQTVTANLAQPENAQVVTDALKTLAFNFRNAPNAIYVDYVKVQEIYCTDATASLPEGRYFEAGKPITLEFTADKAIDAIPAGAITVTTDAGTTVESSVVFDKETQKASITIADAVIGNQYVINVDADKMAEVNASYTGATSFYVEARDVRFTGVIKDTFDNDTVSDGATESGWYLGAVADANAKGSIELVEIEGATGKALKVNGSVTDTLGMNNGYQTVLTKKIGGGIEYKEGNRVIVKTRVMHTNNAARFMLTENRPDTTVLPENTIGWNLYNLFVVNKTSGLYNQNGIEADGNQGKTNALITGDLANQWIDVKIVIDGYNGTMNITASTDELGEKEAINASIKRTSAVMTNHHGAQSQAAVFDALERLSFTFREQNDTLYIDYIEVYESNKVITTAIDAKEVAPNATISAYLKSSNDALENMADFVDVYKDGEIVSVTKTNDTGNHRVLLKGEDELAVGTYTVKYDAAALKNAGCEIQGETEFPFNVINSTDVNETFDGDLTCWAFREDSLTNVTKTATIEEENGNKFLRINVSGTALLAEGKLVTYEKDLTNAKFVRDMENSTVVEMKLRTNLNTVRKYVKLNYPRSGDINVNAYNEHGWNTRLAAVLNNGKLGVAYADYRNENAAMQNQGQVTNVADYETNKWYTVKTVYNNAQGTASTYVYDEAGALVGKSEDNALTAWWFNFYDYKETQPQVMHVIDNISFQFRPNAASVALTDEQLDVDDIKIYNVNTSAEEIKATLTVNGEEVITLTANTTVKPVFTLQPEGKKETTYYAISVKYVNGVMDDVHINPITTTGEVFTEEDGWALGNDITGVTIKAFVWDGLTTMKPLCSVAKASDD